MYKNQLEWHHVEQLVLVTWCWCPIPVVPPLSKSDHKMCGTVSVSWKIIVHTSYPHICDWLSWSMQWNITFDWDALLFVENWLSLATLENHVYGNHKQHSAILSAVATCEQGHRLYSLAKNWISVLYHPPSSSVTFLDNFCSAIQFISPTLFFKLCISRRNFHRPHSYFCK